MIRCAALVAVIGVACVLMSGITVAAPSEPDHPAHSCSADADVQQLTGKAREAFLATCAAGRTPPIAGTANAPVTPADPAEVCNAKAVGAKMTGEARQNYVADCEKKAGEKQP